MKEVTIQEKLPSGAIKLITEQRDEDNKYIPGTRKIRFMVGAMPLHKKENDVNGNV